MEENQPVGWDGFRSGESMLFRVVAGLLLPGGGEVKLLGDSLAGQSPDSRVRMGIGYLK